MMYIRMSIAPYKPDPLTTPEASLHYRPESVFGGKRLREWFQSNFEILDKVTVKIESPYTLWIA